MFLNMKRLQFCFYIKLKNSVIKLLTNTTKNATIHKLKFMIAAIRPNIQLISCAPFNLQNKKDRLDDQSQVNKRFIP